MLSKDSANAIENRLLAALPHNEYQRLLPSLLKVEFPKNRILFEAGQPMDYAHFINDGVVSLVAVAEDGRTIQIGMVGNEGFVGIPITHATRKATSRVVTQSTVKAMKIDAHKLLSACNQSVNLRQILLRYCQLLQIQTSQSALCNPLHSVKQRLARWLLTMSECLHSDSLDLTQEQMAAMLAKHRNLVSTAAREMRKQGLIRFGYGRGQVMILDRKRLENASCECYRLIAESTNDLLRL